MGKIKFKIYKTPSFKKVVKRINYKRRGGNSTVTTGDSTDPKDGWILTIGLWDDNGYWRDEANWQDVSYL
jgi:hypothetical protein